MKRVIVWGLMWLAITGAHVFGAEVSEIYLKDGSVLRAEVVSLQNGVYTLRSESMGEFTLESARISQIGRGQMNQNPVLAAPAKAQQQAYGSPEAFQAKVASTQAKIMKDPEAMQSIISMASEPEFQKLYEDPEAVAALKSGDMETLMKNPRFQEIMNNPKMQGFANNMKDKMQDQQ